LSIEPRKVTGNDFLGKERRFREGRRIEKQTLQVLPQGKTWLKHTTGYQMNDALIFTPLCLPPNIFPLYLYLIKKGCPLRSYGNSRTAMPIRQPRAWVGEENALGI